ncbi:MAG: ankyrin repeat domain-containing protein [Candidatus Dependentiae bacterium]
MKKNILTILLLHLSVPFFGMEKNIFDQGGNELFFDACEKGDWERVKKMLDNGADLLYTDSYANNCLHITKKVSVAQTLITLIKQLPDAPVPFSEFINRMNRQGKTPLHNAVDELNLARVKLLLEHGAIPDHQDNTGETPFHLMVRKKKLYTEKNDFSDMPKQILREDLRFQIFESLCKFGGQINKPNLQGDTPLHTALSQHSVKPDLVKDLLFLGANLKIKNKLGKSSLSLACELKEYPKFFEGLFTDVELPNENNLIEQQKIPSLKEMSFRALFFITSSLINPLSKKINVKTKQIMQKIIKNFYSQQNNEDLSSIFAEYVPTREIGTIYKALKYACKTFLAKKEIRSSLNNIHLLLYQTINSKYRCVKQRWVSAITEPEDAQTISNDLKIELISLLNQVIRPELIAYQNNFLKQYLTMRIQEISLLQERITQGKDLATRLHIPQYIPPLQKILGSINNSITQIQNCLQDIKKKKSSEKYAKTYIIPEKLDDYNTEVDYTLKFFSKLKKIYKMHQRLSKIIKITELIECEIFMPFMKELDDLLKEEVENYHRKFNEAPKEFLLSKNTLNEQNLDNLYIEIKSTLKELLNSLTDEQIKKLQS